MFSLFAQVGMQKVTKQSAKLRKNHNAEKDV